MTFILGMKCRDGIVLCADSLEEDGITKKTVKKIIFIDRVGWSVAVAGAGATPIIEKFFGDVPGVIPNGDFDRYDLEHRIESLLSVFKSRYPDQFKNFNLIVACFDSNTGEHLLYRSDDTILSPVPDEVHFGTGNSLWRLVGDALYSPKNTVSDNEAVGAFVSKLATQYAMGVGEPIVIASFTVGLKDWSFPRAVAISFGGRTGPANEVRSALRKMWNQIQRPTHSDEVKAFGSKARGDEITSLTGVKMELLASASGRNKASTTFWCNRDNLRKRALLVQERAADAVEQNQLPPNNRNPRILPSGT